MAQARREPMQPGLVSDLPPGACSNPNPPGAILERSLGPLDLAWYLLAYAALDLDNAQFFHSVHGRLADGPILPLEVTRARRWADHALVSGDADALATSVGPYVAGLAHLVADREGLEKGDLLRPARGTPAPVPLDGTEPEAATRAVKDVFLSFGVLRALEGNRMALGKMREFVGPGKLPTLRKLVKLMAGAEGQAEDTAEAVASSIAQVIASGGTPVDPMVALAATGRFALWADGSEFKLTLAEPLAAWTARTWQTIVAEHRFRLRDPQITVSAIEAALAVDAAPLTFVASLALAAEPATRTRILGTARTELVRLASNFQESP